MSLKKHKLEVLNILMDNLNQTPPELVPSEKIADQVDLSLSELRHILKSMEGMGVIQTDPDQQFNLITPKGLLWLNKQGINPV